MGKSEVSERLNQVLEKVSGQNRERHSQAHLGSGTPDALHELTGQYAMLSALRDQLRKDEISEEEVQKFLAINFPDTEVSS